MKKLLALLLAIGLALPGFSLAEESPFSTKDVTEAQAEGATEIALANETVVIDAPGVYAVSGTIANGSLRVVLEKEGDVSLLLNGVTVHNDGGAALYTENCDKVVLTLAAGTVNAFSQGPSESENEDAAIYSKDDLTINGTGALAVAGEYKDGVNCRDTLKIVSGDVSVTAADDGLVGKDAVIVGGGTLTVFSTHDCLKATNAEDAQKGYVTLCGGQITLTSTGDGETAATALPDAPADGSAPAGKPPAMPQELSATDATTQATMARGPGGRGGGRDFMGGAEGNQAKTASSAKGVKAAATLTIRDTILTVDAADDALHAVNVLVSSGTLVLTSGDDGVHADDSLILSGGSIQIPACYEGLEGTNIQISGGDIRLTSSDDGVNGAGGDTAQQTDSGFGGRDRFSASTGSLLISGGTLLVDAGGDGIDVNGSLEMTGGLVLVAGPENSGNSALDYDGTFALTGGTLLAAGMSGMAQGVSAPSVPGFMANISGEQGTLTVQNAAGTALATLTAPRPFNSVVFYSDQLAQNEACAVLTTSGSTQIQATTAGTGGGGRFGGR